MVKKTLILMGSPRKKGNTDLLSDAFIKGVQLAGHDSEKIYLKDKKIRGCFGCLACQSNKGRCAVTDDMNELYEKMEAADVIVFASPVYFYTWNSLMKAVIDRTIAIESLLTNKTFYMLSVGQAPDETYMTTMVESFRKYISCFRHGGNREGGYVFGYGVDKPGDVLGTSAIEQAYMMGQKI